MKFVPISKVARFINGRAFKPSEWSSEGLPIIRIQNLTGSTNVVNYFSGRFDNRHFVRDGDILISWSASLGVYIWNGGDALLNQHIFKVDLDERQTDKHYFYYAVSHALEELESKVHGSTMKHVTKDPFEALPIPLPSLLEQKRIAAILAKADHLRRVRRYGLELADTYLQSVFLEMFGDPVDNKRGWNVVQLASQVKRIESGWSPVCEDASSSGDKWAVLKLGAVTTGTYLPGENKVLPTDLEPRSSIEVRKGDVLVTRKNTYELVAACVYVHETLPKLMLPDTIFRFRLKNDTCLMPLYLWGLLSEPHFRSRVQSLAGGSSGSMPNISKEKFMSLAIPLPPLELQHKFAHIVQKFERLRAQGLEAERQAEGLFQTLLHRAFTGELSEKGLEVVK